MTRVTLSRPVLWMVGGSAAVFLALWAAFGARVMPELAYGMCGPLVSAVVSWFVLERAHGSTPERLTAVMMTSFGVKVVLFAAYLVVMLKVLALRPLPFMVSFTGYYVALHAVEAVFLRRLLAQDVAAWPGERQAS